MSTDSTALARFPDNVDIWELPALEQPGFKRLRMDHRKVVFLHLQGNANMDIALVLGKSPAWVGNVLRNPTVVPVLDALYSDYDTELKGMMGLAVDAIRTNLESGDGSLQLKSADLLFKVSGRYNRTESSGNNAEAVIARFMAEIDEIKEDKKTSSRLVMLEEGNE